MEFLKMHILLPRSLLKSSPLRGGSPWAQRHFCPPAHTSGKTAIGLTADQVPVHHHFCLPLFPLGGVEFSSYLLQNISFSNILWVGTSQASSRRISEMYFCPSALRRCSSPFLSPSSCWRENHFAYKHCSFVGPPSLPMCCFSVFSGWLLRGIIFIYPTWCSLCCLSLKVHFDIRFSKFSVIIESLIYPLITITFFLGFWIFSF